MISSGRRRAILALVLTSGIVALLLASAGVAALLPQPVSDLLALGQGTGDTPAMAPVQHNSEPPLTATPRAQCGPGSHPLNGMQGRVPASAIKNAPGGGYTCNVTLISHQGQSGGFKVFRYVDQHGHVCAFYDTALLFPINAVRLYGPSLGVAVLDMSDPAHPVQTATLSTPPMLSPHESLSLSTSRGLLAAVMGNPYTYPGDVAIYDVSQDCRHPVLDSDLPVAKLGHEGNFSADGRTFYAAATGYKILTAIDVTDPKHPHPVWQGNLYSHGLTLSDDGNRAYVADPINSQLLILDTSQIQSRQSDPHAREISRLAWNSATIPQNAIPIQINGTSYLLEFDEYAFRFSSPAPPDTVGAARLINISNEAHPYVVSNLRLEVDQPAQHHEASGDPGQLDPAQGYAAHYCNVPSEVNPEIAACSFISSGLRIFDIRDPEHPREVAYYVAPPHSSPENGGDGSNFAMSKPAFDPSRREIWYSDGTSGFYVLRVPKSVWPDPTTSACQRATGRLSGRHLGPVKLGRKHLRGVSAKAGRHLDYLCLRGGGIHIGYPSRALLKSLSDDERARVAGRVVLALTANHHYALHGVRPGARFRKAARLLHLGSGVKVGRSTWFVVPLQGASGILSVRGGVVRQVGIADRRLTDSSNRARRFLARFV